MIIDLILDRKDGAVYNAEDFYRDIIDYENIFELSRDISVALPSLSYSYLSPESNNVLSSV